MSPKISKDSIATQVAEELRRRILGGKYPGGMKLLQEQIAFELGVSRSPLREALRQLEAEGLINFESQKGATVVVFELADAEEFFEMRLLLEPHLLQLSVPRMTPDLLNNAETIILEMETAQVSTWGALNLKLHLLLYEPAERPGTLAVIRRAHQKIDQYLRRQITITDGRDAAKREHAEIVEACRLGHVDHAVLLLKLHIYNAAAAIRMSTTGSQARLDIKMP